MPQTKPEEKTASLSGTDLIAAYRSEPDRFLPMIVPAGKRGGKNEYGETDIGWNAGLLPDERPFFVECWAADGATFLSFYLSARGIEEHSGDDILQMIQKTSYFHLRYSGGETAEAETFTGPAGEAFFSVTITAGVEEAPARVKGAPILPWSALNESQAAARRNSEEGTEA